MDGNAKGCGGLDQIAGHGPVAPRWDQATGRMVMGNDDGGRAQFQASLENLARIHMDGRHRSGGSYFIAKKLIAGIEIEHPKLFVGGKGHHSPQIFQDRRFACKNCPSWETPPKDNVDGGPDRGEQPLDIIAADGLDTVRLRRVQCLWKRPKAIKKPVRQLLRTIWLAKANQFFQELSTPSRARRRRCRQVATIRMI